MNRRRKRYLSGRVYILVEKRERDRIYGRRDMYGREEDKHTGILDLVYDWARYTRMYIIGKNIPWWVWEISGRYASERIHREGIYR